MELEQIDKIISLYKDGSSLRDIGRVMKISQSTACKYVSRAGLKRRGMPHGGRPGIDKPTFDPRPKTRFGVLEVIAKDPHLYPTRWRCKCIQCKKYILADKAQLLRNRDHCTHKAGYIPRWKR
jgi:hypothetical protein